MRWRKWENESIICKKYCTFVFYYIMKSIKAYFDGNTIRLEDSVELEKIDKLLVIREQEPGDNVDKEDIEKSAVHDIMEDYLTEEELKYYRSLK